MAERAEEIYQALLKAGVQEKDILQKLEEKNLEYQGFMSKQGMLYQIAKDYGIDVETKENREMLDHITEEVIDYNDFAIPISSIVEGMQNIVITGRITEISSEHEFTKKDGSTGRVASFRVCDESATMKVVLWDDQINNTKNEYFKIGQIIQVVGGYSKKGYKDPLEVHLSKKGKIILVPEGTKLPKVEKHVISASDKKEIPSTPSKDTIQDLYEKEGFIKSISGTVKVVKFKEIDKKDGDKAFLLTLSLSDKTASINVNIWGLAAIEILKSIEDGMNVRISNVMVKENTFSNTKELSFTKSSRLESI